MATAADTYTFDTIGAALKIYLGITDTSEDTNLTLWISWAAADCDDYVGWYWTDADGDVQDHTPSPHNPKVLGGIYAWVKAYRAYETTIAPGRSMVKTGALQENYQGGVAGLTAQSLARDAAYDLWSGSIYNLSLAAK